jgi:hypothetical protein
MVATWGCPSRLGDPDSGKCRVAREIDRRPKAQPEDSVVGMVVGIPQIADL